MEFIRNIDLNRICRILDYTAVVFLILGVVGTLILGIDKDRYGYTTIDWTIIVCGICATFLNSLFLLFLSRIGDAIDDIWNKYVLPDMEQSVEE